MCYILGTTLQIVASEVECYGGRLILTTEAWLSGKYGGVAECARCGRGVPQFVDHPNNGHQLLKAYINDLPVAGVCTAHMLENVFRAKLALAMQWIDVILSCSYTSCTRGG